MAGAAQAVQPTERMNLVLRFLELETLRFACTPVIWRENGFLMTMWPMQAREMQDAG